MAIFEFIAKSRLPRGLSATAVNDLFRSHLKRPDPWTCRDGLMDLAVKKIAPSRHECHDASNKGSTVQKMDRPCVKRLHRNTKTEWIRMRRFHGDERASSRSRNSAISGHHAKE